jgi:acetoin utilization deacetylase AcuC-like enzyme
MSAGADGSEVHTHEERIRLGRDHTSGGAASSPRPPPATGVDDARKPLEVLIDGSHRPVAHPQVGSEGPDTVYLLRVPEQLVEDGCDDAAVDTVRRPLVAEADPHPRLDTRRTVGTRRPLHLHRVCQRMRSARDRAVVDECRPSVRHVGAFVVPRPMRASNLNPELFHVGDQCSGRFVRDIDVHELGDQSAQCGGQGARRRPRQFDIHRVGPTVHDPASVREQHVAARKVKNMLLVGGDPALDRHDAGPSHPERAARVHSALSGIDDAGLTEAVVHLEPRRATEEELCRVHPPSYLDALRSFCESGGGHLDPDTVAGPGSWDTARLAAGAALAAVDGLRRGDGDAAFVAARPPGHHALADQPMGFCLLNNVAVAAASLTVQGERVMIVDWDVHHGNGTQALFWDDPLVLYVSTHEWPLYPGTGAVGETGGAHAPGLTVNIPVPAGATGNVLCRAFDDVVAPVAEHFAPTWVLVSAGFDAHRDDPLADLALTAGDFADLAARALAFAPAPGRTALFLEGGYELNALRNSVGAATGALLGADYRPEPSSSGGPGAAAVEAAGRVHGVWPDTDR